METKKKSYGFIVAAVCFGVFFTGTYGQYQLSPLAPQIMQSLQIDAAQYSLLFTVCMYPSLLLSIVSGMLCDKFGVKSTVGIAVLLSTIGIAGRVFVSEYSAMVCCMAVLGLGCMFLTATNAKILAPHFAPEKLGSVMGVVNSASTIAMFIAMATTAWFSGVKQAYIFSAIIAVAVFISWMVFIKPETQNASDVTLAAGVSMGESLKRCCKNRYIWFSGLTLMVLMAGQVIVASFMPQALQAVKGYSAEMAGYMTSVYMLGAIAGSMFGPQIFAKLRAKRIFLNACIVIVSLGIAFGWNISSPVALGIILVICGAALSTFIPILYALPVSLPDIGPVYAGTAGGLSATIQIIGATIIPTNILTPLFGTDFNMLFIAAGCVCALGLITVNMLPLFGKN